MTKSYRPGPIAYVTVVCVTALAACSGATSNAVNPELPFKVPASFGAPVAEASSASTADLLVLGLEAWWLEFDSDELDAAVHAALAGNRDLRAAAARVDAARAQTRAITGARLPQVGAGLELSRARRNFIGLPIPGAPDVVPVTTSQHGLGLDLSWELDLWQRLDAAERAAVSDADAVEADRRALALALAGQTTRTWFSIAHQDELLALLDARTLNAEDSLAWCRQRYAAGSGDAASIASAESALAGVRAQWEREHATRSAALAQLDLLCGRYPRVEAAEMELPAAPTPMPAGIPADLLERRPDLTAAAARVHAAHARAKEAEAARLPRLQLTANGGTVSEALGDLLDGDFRVWGLAAGLTAPLFDGGRLRAQAEGAAALTVAAESDYVGRALIGFAEVETALAAETRLRTALQRSEDAVASWLREADAARRRFTNGTAPAGTLFARTDALLEARTAALSLRYTLLLNRVDLLLALGGGIPPLDRR